MSEYNFEIDPRITIEGIIASILDASELWDLLECKNHSPRKAIAEVSSKWAAFPTRSEGGRMRKLTTEDIIAAIWNNDEWWIDESHPVEDGPGKALLKHLPSDKVFSIEVKELDQQSGLAQWNARLSEQLAKEKNS
jgi:hypothetical protein